MDVTTMRAKRTAWLAMGIPLLLAVPEMAASAAPPPNVVLIIGDDMGYTDFGFMGSPVVRTPRLDRLAAESLTFRRGYVTSSLCCPSLATIVTGLYPHQHKVVSNDPPAVKGSRDPRGSSPELIEKWNAALDGIPTLPRRLGGEGYLSFQTGKWWQGDFSRGGFTHGMTRGSRHGDEGLAIGRKGIQPVRDFLQQARKQGKPFFVWYAPMMPHAPHHPPARLLEAYRAKTDSLPVARYWAMCEWFDETVGEVLDCLDEEGLRENTLVVYVCDNGWIQSPTRPNAFAPKNKTTPYDFGHRTPILVRWPGRIRPEIVDQPVSSIDIAPTILAAVRSGLGKDLPGVDLRNAAAVAGRDAVFGACFSHTARTLDDPASNLLWRWVVADRWRLIVPRSHDGKNGWRAGSSDWRLTPDLVKTLEDGRPLLFDVLADPREEQDLSERHKERTRELLSKLDAWWSPAPAP